MQARSSHSLPASQVPSAIVCYLSSVLCHLSSVICYLLSVICYLLSVICYLLSVICYLLSVVCSLAVMCESVCTTTDLWQLLLPSRRLSYACHSDVMCCVAQCIGDLDMQLAFKLHLPASGMHGQKKEFSNTNFTKRDTINLIADLNSKTLFPDRAWVLT